jgi:hypothetical protein
MCRSIKKLRGNDGRASDEEIEAAALQFVRKVSGFQRPSQKNEHAFNEAVAAIAAESRRLLESLEWTS